MKSLFSLHYFPPIEWFVYWMVSDYREIEQHDNFQKGSYRNRCYIATPNGEQLLSVPLLSGKHQKKTYREVEISYDHPWQHEHWRSLEASYRSSPYFEFYEDRFKPYFTQPYKHLYEFNLELLNEVFKCLKVNPDYQLTESYHKTPVLTDFRHQIKPQNRKKSDVIKSITYLQVFSDKTGFISGLSILDMLFNLGPESIEILNQEAEKLKSSLVFQQKKK